MPEKEKTSEFKCGGLAGAILELGRLCGIPEEELHRDDERWHAMCSRSSSLPNEDE